MVSISNSRLPRMAPRTPKDVSATDTDSVFMNLYESEQAKKTGLDSAGAPVLACTDGRGKQRQRQNMWFLRILTFELSLHQRRDARARMAKMYSVPPAGPAWHAVGARLERGVRQRCAKLAPTASSPQKSDHW